MEGLHTVKDLIRPGVWMVIVDLKDAYFAIPVHREHRKFLRFRFKGKTFEFNCLPFGLSSSPWVFTKTLKPAAALFWELRVRLIIYMDDILVSGESLQQLQDHAGGLTYLLECLGFIINTKKCTLKPTQELEFSGSQVNTIRMELKLPGEKMKNICLEAGKLLGEGCITVRTLSLLLRKMNAASQVIPHAPLFSCHLQRCLARSLNHSNQNYELIASLNQENMEELRWWNTEMIK